MGCMSPPGTDMLTPPSLAHRALLWDCDLLGERGLWAPVTSAVWPSLPSHGVSCLLGGHRHSHSTHRCKEGLGVQLR